MPNETEKPADTAPAQPERSEQLATEASKKKTSELIGMLVVMSYDSTPEQDSAAEVIAAEIDRRIPIPPVHEG